MPVVYTPTEVRSHPFQNSRPLDLVLGRSYRKLFPPFPAQWRALLDLPQCQLYGRGPS